MLYRHDKCSPNYYYYGLDINLYPRSEAIKYIKWASQKIYHDGYRNRTKNSSDSGRAKAKLVMSKHASQKVKIAFLTAWNELFMVYNPKQKILVFPTK